MFGAEIFYEKVLANICCFEVQEGGVELVTFSVEIVGPHPLSIL